MEVRNKEIRDYIKSKKVPMWRIAEELGISDSSFSRLLRYKVSEEKKIKICEIADRLSDEYKD